MTKKLPGATLAQMCTVGLKTLKNQLSEYVRLAAAGETVVITDRGRAVAEIVPRRRQQNESFVERGVREGWLTPATKRSGDPPPRKPIKGYSFEQLMADLERDREDAFDLPRQLGAPRPPAHRGTPAFGEFLGAGLCRLLEYEVWNRIWARGLGQSHRDVVGAALAKIEMIELTRLSLRRALEPFPVGVPTLGALHLATIDFVRGSGEPLELASYDTRLLAAAQGWEFQSRNCEQGISTAT